MSWDRKRNKQYYYRNTRINGEPRKVYVGPGRRGKEAEQHDLDRRIQRETSKQEWEQVIAALDAPSQVQQLLEQAAKLLVRATLLIHGYHLHKRSEWRKRQHDNT